jgi:hypothetical protein
MPARPRRCVGAPSQVLTLYDRSAGRQRAEEARESPATGQKGHADHISPNASGSRNESDDVSLIRSAAPGSGSAADDRAGACAAQG